MQDKDLRLLAHKVIDQADPQKLKAILSLLDEEYFSADEIAEIKSSSASVDWVDWRSVRNDL